MPAARAGARPEFAYVDGKRLHLLGVEPLGELRRPLFAPLLGDDLPLAIPSPSGGQIVYHAWDGSVRGPGVPVLSVYTREGGPERLLARGAQSAAWRRDGAVAYMKATAPRYVPNTLGGSYGQVVVRASLDAPPVAWTDEQRRRYVVLGWARATLLVQIEPSNVTLDHRLPGVYALDGPGRLRPVPLSELVAISSDGRRAVGTHRVGDGATTAVRLVDLATGRLRASAPLRFVARQGDWAADTVVAVVSAGRRNELAILRTGPRSLSLLRRLQPASGFLSRPLFVRGTSRVVVHASQARFAGFLSCDLVRSRCVRGSNLLPRTTWASVIDNPSRPE